MQHIASYAKSLWEAGETDYQKASTAFLQDALESDDPFAYLWGPVTDRMGGEYGRLRKARIASLPVPSVGQLDEDEAAPAETESARAAHGRNAGQTRCGSAGALPADGSIPEGSAHDPYESQRADGVVLAGHESIPGTGVQDRDESQSLNGAGPGEQDLPARGAQNHDESHGHDGPATGGEPVPTVSEIPAADIPEPPPTPAQQRMAHLGTEVYTRTRGHIPWEDVTVEDAVTTIMWSRTVVRGIEVNSERMQRAISQMKRHRVNSVGDLPVGAAAYIFAELAA